LGISSQPILVYDQLRSLRSKMLETIKNIDPSRISDIQGLRTALTVLINAVEQLLQEKEDLKKENQQLRDENNKLKGGNGRPVIKPSRKRDISSKGREQGSGLGKVNKDKNLASPPIEIDREIKVEIAPDDLPAAAVFKGYVQYQQQDIRISRNNKKFLLATYYSASENRTIKAAFPAGEIEGHFGPGVRSLITILHHYGNITHSGLEGLLNGLGIHISAGSISNLLKAGHDWAVAEQKEILQAGLGQPAPKQMDSTSNRQRGMGKVTHIITAPFFSIFYTLSSKSRMDCLRALQGNPEGGVPLMWHKDMEPVFQASGVSKADSASVLALLSNHGASPLSIGEFTTLLEKHAANIHEKTRIISLLTEAMALYHYIQQDSFPRLEVLLSNDAPEYNKIACFHALCWIHDARYYNKLAPYLQTSIDKLENFKNEYWGFYQTLLDYKALPICQQNEEKIKIEAAFDSLFRPTTCYGALDLCIERTRKNKEQLLRVLDFPDLPLHNNGAELAARKIVRKRDISLHTWTDWGTQLRDAFLSIIETAKKLGVSAYQYINDRVTGQLKMPSLAQMITAFSP
jgi:Transposase IS66 family